MNTPRAAQVWAALSRKCVTRSGSCRTRFQQQPITGPFRCSPEWYVPVLAKPGCWTIDDPALCPEDPDELDGFRREHEDVTIWCGTMFEGGCGRQLMTKRCTDLICHFAHCGSAGDGNQRCRKERGKDSADHVFVKATLASWLRGPGIAAEFTYPKPHGAAMMIRLEDGRSRLVHLDCNRSVDWDNDAWETILGLGLPRTPGVLAQRGYVYRIRLGAAAPLGSAPRSGGIRLVWQDDTGRSHSLLRPDAVGTVPHGPLTALHRMFAIPHDVAQVAGMLAFRRFPRYAGDHHEEWAQAPQVRAAIDAFHLAVGADRTSR